jgi:hypothetical protein
MATAGVSRVTLQRGGLKAFGGGGGPVDEEGRGEVVRAKGEVLRGAEKHPPVAGEALGSQGGRFNLKTMSVILDPKLRNRRTRRRMTTSKI